MSAVIPNEVVPAGLPSGFHESPPGSPAFPYLILSAALDDPRTGLVIFDSQLRVLHITSQTTHLLNLQRVDPIEGLTVLQLLTQSALDTQCVEEAKARITEFNNDGPDSSMLLQGREGSPNVRMRLRTIAHEYRVASFETAVPDSKETGASVEFTAPDSVTGLISRHEFQDIVTRALADHPEQPVTLLLVDLNRFKSVNDNLGHAAGDTLLRLAAERLKAAVRKEDVVARLRGNEFAVFVQSASHAEQTILLAIRMLDLIQRTYLIGGQAVSIGASIGIAQAPAHGRDCALLLRCADLALYHSKASGRATYKFFEEFMERQAQARRTSELELRRALALRQFELFYQPQVNSSTNRLVGFEALIRWRHPEKGMISPADFLPIAEEIGAIVPIGEWVLRTACREAVNWPDSITVAVNASPLQFDSGDFANVVRKALAISGLPPERLEIEITEGLMLRTDEAVLNTLHELRSMNVRIAMDDFGVGYASLSQLARFPFDKIKIDRSLAGINGEDPKQRSIVRAITTLGRSLGVGTLAEGVEDAAQIERLKVDGCTSVQGYFYSRPIPTKDIQGLLERFAT